jgi:hypothetical protein
MRIKAKFFNQDIVIIDFVSVYEKAIKVIYVDQEGTIDSCYLDSNDLKVVDNDYLPKKRESKIAEWCDMVERNEKWMG